MRDGNFHTWLHQRQFTSKMKSPSDYKLLVEIGWILGNTHLTAIILFML